MSSPVITVREDATLRDVIEIMLDHRVLGLPVINMFGHLVGIITESDFMIRETYTSRYVSRVPRAFEGCEKSGDIHTLYRTALTVKAQDVMSSPVITVTEQDSIKQVIELMLTHDISRIPVLHGKIPVGIVTCRDLLELMAQKFVLEHSTAGILETAG